MKRTVIIVAFAVGWLFTGVYMAVAQTNWPRFHRYALTRLDDTTTLDVVKDANPTGKPVCRLVYRVRETHRGPVNATSVHHEAYPVVAVTYLGEVPCDPVPVPPAKGGVPPASPIRESEGGH